MWANSDPRLALIDRKRALLVVLRPHLSGDGWEAGTALAEMHQGWCVITSFENHRVVAEGDTWDPLWMWTVGPGHEANAPLAVAPTTQ